MMFALIPNGKDKNKYFFLFFPPTFVGISEIFLVEWRNKRENEKLLITIIPSSMN